MGASHPPVSLKVIKSIQIHTALARNSQGSAPREDSLSRSPGADTTDHPVTMLKFSNEYSQSVWPVEVVKPEFNISEGHKSDILIGAGYNSMTSRLNSPKEKGV